MGLFNWHCPLTKQCHSINLTPNFFVSVENRTGGSWVRSANPTSVLCYPPPPQDWKRWKSQALGEIWIQVLLVMRHALYLGAATTFHVPSLELHNHNIFYICLNFIPVWKRRRLLNLFGSCWHWTRRACATLHQLCHRHIAYFKVRVYLESLHPARFFLT